MADRKNSWMEFAKLGVTAGAALGVAATMYYAYENFQNHRDNNKYELYDRRQESRQQSTSSVRINEIWGESHDDSSRNQNQSQNSNEKLIKLREERRRQFEKEQEERKEMEIQKNWLAAKERLEERRKLQEKKENDRIKMESMLEVFDAEFDMAIGGSTNKEPVDEEFENWSRDKEKQQLKQAHIRKKHASSRTN